ncbi:MAG: alpha-hydroxy-acid oxidizing protein [Burkholderiaceae bacterium]|nr:alpha-hydroxy-acid oxidizing protein [Burkholderiaceae bacterium]
MVNPARRPLPATGRSSAPNSRRGPNLALGLLGAALGAAATAWLAERRSGARQAAFHPGRRAGLERLRLPSSPALLDGTPRRRLRTSGNLARAQTIADLRAMAHARLPSFALEYLEGGSEEEAALARNLDAFAQWHFAPPVLVDVSQRDVSSELFDAPMSMPIVIAPTGLNALFWPHADTALAQAAADAGIPCAQSTMSNDRMEDVGRTPGLRHWWQLYVFGPPSVSEALIARADAAGCEALIVTTGAQIYGNREWDRRNRVPSGNLDWSSEVDALLHPRWLASTILEHGMPRFENVLDYVPTDKRSFFDSAFWIRSQMDQALSWRTIARIREAWPHKLLVKGLLGPGDAVRAVAAGVDALILSNHGGRQLDWSASALDLLPATRQAVGNAFPLLVDGGVRRGTDIVKALALGADAVLIGRAALYGVAAGGRDGVGRALDILRDELQRDLGLLGARSIAELGPHLLRPANRDAGEA